jgi:hypothetical protein
MSQDPGSSAFLPHPLRRVGIRLCSGVPNSMWQRFMVSVSFGNGEIALTTSLSGTFVRRMGY